MAAIEGSGDIPARKRIVGAALPKARQWLDWISYQYTALPSDHGWAAQCRDLLIGLHHSVATCARRLRGNPTFDLQGTMTEDTAPLEDEAIRWLHQAEAIAARMDLPVRFLPFVELLAGACKQQVRLAHEIDRMHKYGEILVDVTYDRHAQRLVETG